MDILLRALKSLMVESRTLGHSATAREQFLLPTLLAKGMQQSVGEIDAPTIRFVAGSSNSIDQKTPPSESGSFTNGDFVMSFISAFIVAP